jgi:hypothetical protein
MSTGLSRHGLPLPGTRVQDAEVAAASHNRHQCLGCVGTVSDYDLEHTRDIFPVRWDTAITELVSLARIRILPPNPSPPKPSPPTFP